MKNFGYGNCACLVGAFFGGVSFILFLVDLNMPPDSKKRQSNSQLQFVYANMLFIWSIVIGSVIFTYVEGWDFEKASLYW